ncbi:hypothetical protein [Fulvivirga sp.]|uniref:hypothetical protein n=1 Tax=Fulvivirga sp. TaxID=1931237 RepID=UPI0032EC6AA4
MRKASIIILLLATTLFGFTGLQEPIDELVLKIENYFDRRPMEKVFLHLDKPFYTLGERVWFKAYTLDYQTNLPSKLSENLNVMITDQESQLLENVKITLDNGLGAGYIQIPNIEGLTQVQISAYTNWMRNFDESLYFKRVITIGSSPDKTEFLNTNFKVKLFPEGGTILNQKITKIGFKANVPAKLSGYVIKNGADTITSVLSDSMGYGAFSFIPNANDTYRAIFKQGNNHVEVDMPLVREKGTTLRVDQKGEFINIVAECSPDFNGQNASIIIQNNGRLLYSIEGTFENNGILARLKSNMLIDGLISVTLFDDNNRILNETLFYNANKNYKATSDLNISGLHSAETRSNVSFDIKWGQNNIAYASVSITPNKYFKDDHLPSITEHINLLTASDIMRLPNPSTHEINDKLLSHSLKPFRWDSIISNAQPSFKYAIEKKDLFQISGNIINGSGFNEGDIYGITLYNKEQDFYFSRFQKDKRFNFSVPSFTGSRKLILKALGVGKDKPDLIYNIDFHVPSSIINQFSYLQQNGSSDYIMDSKENFTIDRMYNISRVQDEPTKTMNEQMSFSILKAPDNTIRLEDYVPLPNMAEIAREILEGVRIKVDQRGEAEIRMRSINEESGYFMDFNKEQPLLFIDGLLINDPNTIAQMNPLNIESIDMSYGQYTLNGISFKGILAIHTVEKNYAELNEGAHGIFTITGFQEPKKYVTPKIDLNSPDFRTLLYWNPNLTLQPNKESKISFTTSDETGSYTINIQGVTEEGVLISKSWVFEVTSSYK